MVSSVWENPRPREGTLYPSAQAAIEALRAANPASSTRDLPAFVVGKDGKPLGPIVDHDSVILYNFRGDRASS
jgi:2,3-bisphosphoglycerate-independent phosphoglycerate mutase